MRKKIGGSNTVIERDEESNGKMACFRSLNSQPLSDRCKPEGSEAEHGLSPCLMCNHLLKLQDELMLETRRMNRSQVPDPKRSVEKHGQSRRGSRISESHIERIVTI